MKEIHFFDIDGTLLEHKSSQIKPEIINSLKQMMNNGLIVVICTGRNYSTSKQYIDQIGSPHFILSNGLNVYHDNKVLYNIHFTCEELGYLQSIIQPRCKHTIYMSNDNVVLLDDEHTDSIVEHLSGYGLMEINIVDEITTQKIQKLSVTTNSPEDLNFIIDSLNDKYICYKWSETQCEIQFANYNKAVGISKFLENFNNDVKTFAYGDGVNDSEMFEAVDISYAMGNANDYLKSIATNIIGDVSDGAIYTHLKNEYTFIT